LWAICASYALLCIRFRVERDLYVDAGLQSLRDAVGSFLFGDCPRVGGRRSVFDVRFF